MDYALLSAGENGGGVLNFSKFAPVQKYIFFSSSIFFVLFKILINIFKILIIF